GCMLASLGTEGARDPALRAALAAGAVGLAEVLAELLAARHPGAGPGACETAALGILAAMNGGLALARALADEPARSGAALRGAATAAHAAVDCFAPTDSAPGPA
ncbi:MAG: hypothetical protein KGQ40_13625, partial [Rhodospirillales bacterium]|nr:hypothetical protein [Rhodospirillales bacterium]